MFVLPKTDFLLENYSVEKFSHVFHGKFSTLMFEKGKADKFYEIIVCWILIFICWFWVLIGSCCINETRNKNCWAVNDVLMKSLWGHWIFFMNDSCQVKNLDIFYVNHFYDFFYSTQKQHFN